MAGGAGAGSRAQADQGATACGAGPWSWLWAVALSEPADGGAAARAWRGRSSASTIWAALRRRGQRTGASRPRRRALGGGGDPAMRLAHALEVNALTLDGGEGATLSATWSWAPALIDEAEVRALAQGWFQALEALVRHAAQPAAGGRTPSDLPLVVAVAGRDRAAGERTIRRLRTFCRCRRCRRGCCSMRCCDAQGPDIYTMQIGVRPDGPLDAGDAQGGGAGAAAAPCQPAGGFQHDNLSRPVQIIVPSPALPWRSIDLSLLDEAGRERAWEILAQDRAEHFDLAAPPLIRFTLIRLGADRASAAAHQPSHPDGRLVGAGAGAGAADALCAAGRWRALPRVTPYRDYLAWIAAQDRAAAVAAWSEALSGLEEPTLAGGRRDRGGRRCRRSGSC